MFRSHRIPGRARVAALATLFALTLGALPAAAAAIAQEGTVPSADGVPIHYAVTGDGPVALVLVHGWSCDGGYWSNQVAAFAPKYRVVTIDLAGHGKSGRDRKDWTTAAFAGDVKAVVEKLDLKKAVLVGHSMGGPVCVAAAGAMPGRVIEVIGVDTMEDANQHVTPEQLKPYLDQLHANFRGFVTQFVHAMFPAGSDSAIVKRVADGMSSAPPEVAIPVFANVFSYDLKAGFAAVKAPIREINSDSQPTNFEGNRKFAKDFDAVILKGTGHFPQLVRPAEFNAALGKLVAEVAP